MIDFLQTCDMSKNEIFSYLVIFFRGLVSFFLYYIISLVFKSIIKQIFSKLGSQKKSAADLLSKGLSLLLIGLGFISALGEWGLDVRGLIATLGLTGFALGLALKDAISNMISGVLIILYTPFKIGSKVRILGKEGIVTKIEIKHTVIEGEGGILHILPNSKILSETVSILK